MPKGKNISSSKNNGLEDKTYGLNFMSCKNKKGLHIFVDIFNKFA